MLAMSPLLSPNLGWDYPIELETNHVFDNFALDNCTFIPDYSQLSQLVQNYPNNQDQSNDDHDQIKRSESPQGTSSTNYCDNPILTKKLNHNASERDRRKKINNMYSSLRALLPAIDQRKKQSIPATVTRVLEYIPELQKEVENLTHKKKLILSKISSLQGDFGDLIKDDNDEKSKNCIIKETTSSCSISVSKIDDKEMVIQISSATLERIIISEVLLLLEINAHFIIHVSSFQSFGGRSFYNLHLWMGGSNNINFEKLKGVLLSLLQKQEQMPMYS